MKKAKYIVFSYGLEGDENFGYSTIKDVREDLTTILRDAEYAGTKITKGFPRVFNLSTNTFCHVDHASRTVMLNGKYYKF